MRLLSEDERATQALLEANAEQVEQALQTKYLSRAASPSVSTDWERATDRAPINMSPYVNTRDCGGRRRSTAASCQAVIGTLEDAVRALHADATSSYRRVESALFGPDLLLDARVLDTLVPRTKEAPHQYVGLKHVKYRSMLDERHAEEFLLLETAGKGRNPHTGMPFIFKAMHSVEAPEREFEISNANSHHAHLKVHRGAVHTLLLVLAETSHRGILKMQLWLDMELTKCAEPFYGAFSSLHDAFSLSVRYRQLVENYASSAAGSDAALVASTSSSSRFHMLPARSSRERKCQTCQHSLGFFSRKKNHLCTLCGLCVCSSCLTPTTFRNWRLCDLCFERNERLLERTRVSRMATLSAGLGGTLRQLTRITRSYSKQRDSILQATAAAAGELPPHPMQDTKERPPHREPPSYNRRTRFENDCSGSEETNPMARSVIGIRRGLRGGSRNAAHNTNLSASMGPGHTNSSSSSADMSASVGPGGHSFRANLSSTMRIGRSQRRNPRADFSQSHGPGRRSGIGSLLRRPGERRAYDPEEDIGSDLRASLFDGTNGSFVGNGSLLSTGHGHSASASNQDNHVDLGRSRVLVGPSDRRREPATSTSSATARTQSTGRRHVAPPSTATVENESKPTRMLQPSRPSFTRAGSMRSSSSSSSSSKPRTSSLSKSTAAFYGAKRLMQSTKQSWASASAGPGFSTPTKSKQKTKLLPEDDLLHTSPLSTTWCSSSGADPAEPVKPEPQTAEQLTLADLEPVSQSGRVCGWV